MNCPACLTAAFAAGLPIQCISPTVRPLPTAEVRKKRVFKPAAHPFVTSPLACPLVVRMSLQGNIVRALEARLASGIGRKTSRNISGDSDDASVDGPGASAQDGDAESDSHSQPGDTDMEPPEGLLLEDLVAEVNQVVEGDVTGALGQFIKDKMVALSERAGDSGVQGALASSASWAASFSPAFAASIKRRVTSGVKAATGLRDAAGSSAAELRDARIRKLMEGGLGAIRRLRKGELLEDAMNRLAHLAATGDGEGKRRVTGAFAAAFAAVGGGADDNEDGDDSLLPLSDEELPEFDHVNALILAGYAFQAYLQPPRGAYWETYASMVRGSNVSGRALQTIRTLVAYTATESISASAGGLFMVHIEPPKGPLLENRGRILDKDCHLVVILNNTGMHEVDFTGQNIDFSLLRKNESDNVTKEDKLNFLIYESKEAHANGEDALVSAEVELSTLVAESKGVPGGSRLEAQPVVFRRLDKETVEDNFFKFDMLPEGLSFPFELPRKGARNRTDLEQLFDGVQVVTDISFIPFDMPAGYAVEDEYCADEDEVKDDDTFEFVDEKVDEEQAALISQRMAAGEIPLDWAKLARGLQAVVAEVGLPKGKDRHVREDLRKAVFIESTDTDSEVWIWRDEMQKHIIVSFRGTEQVKWKDFFTDALAFLQVWQPGQDIVLDIGAGKTAGLDIWDVVLYGDEKQQEDVLEQPCVHWGFLRAYLSVRDALEHNLYTMTNGFNADYKFFFTGHSLGGALATLAAVDLQARHGAPLPTTTTTAPPPPPSSSSRHPLPIVMVNYGSPRVGNRAFARTFNSHVPHAFRVVNGADIVARMPRTPALRGGYRHVARVCVVDQGGAVWVERSAANGSSAAPFPTELDDIGELLRHEREIWKLLVSGNSLGHHMEDAYFVAMKNVVRNVFGSDGGKKRES